MDYFVQYLLILRPVIPKIIVVFGLLPDRHQDGVPPDERFRIEESDYFPAFDPLGICLDGSSGPLQYLRFQA